MTISPGDMQTAKAQMDHCIHIAFSPLFFVDIFCSITRFSMWSAKPIILNAQKGRLHRDLVIECHEYTLVVSKTCH